MDSCHITYNMFTTVVCKQSEPWEKHSDLVSNFSHDLLKCTELLFVVKQGEKVEYFHGDFSPESPQVTKNE